MSYTLPFHPAVERWFRRTFPAPTEPQAEAWREIKSGRNVLVAAPTGSGKTLAAFLAAIDDLVRRRRRRRRCPTRRCVVYVSPLKALSNDIQKNLALPLAGIRDELEALGLPDVEIRTLVRTGDTPQAERAGMRKRPPHIVVTTPESLYVLLGSESGRKMLSTTRTRHRRRDPRARRQQARQPSRAVARAARRADAASRRCASGSRRRRSRSRRSRASWSASATPGAAKRDDCAIVDTGHVRARDLALEVPSSPLEAVMSHEVWEQVYARLAELALTHRTTLDVRQHAAHGRARGAPSVRAARRRARDVASRQHGEGAAAQGRAAAEARRAEGAGRHRVARARHRHRRRRARLPARLAALDRDVPAARGAREPPGRRRAQGAPLSAVARRAGRMRGAARRGAARRARPPDHSAQAARRARAADRRRSRRAGLARGRAVRSRAPRVSVSRRSRATSSSTSCARSPTASARAAGIAPRTCIATRSTACCAAGAARA